MERANDSLHRYENKGQDESILQMPINIGVKNVREILKCLQIGTKEIKDIILNECNIIYECKICRNLFRSLANLISHKRVYCQKHCCESMTLFSNIETDESTLIVLPEKPPENDEEEEEEEKANECTKEENLNSENLVSSIGISSPKIFVPSEKESRQAKLEKWEEKNSSSSLNEEPSKKKDERILYLNPIEGNTNAVFQQIHDKNHKIQENNVGKDSESGKKLVVIIPKNVTNSSKTVSEDKTFGINISRQKLLSGRGDCDTESLTCLICSTQYACLKTLYLHMINLHSQRRWYYPCPFCKTSFVQLWGVTRHLIKVHKKNKDQISKLRVVIKKRAFLKCFDNDTLEMNEDIQSEENPIIFNNDEQDHKEITHKCSKCSRTFTHRSSVVNHEKFCVKNKTKPIIKPFINSHNSNESSIISRPKRIVEKKVNKDFINSQTLKWRSANKVDTNSKLRKCNPEVYGKKLESIINSKRLSCLKCHKKFCSLSNLKRHAAIHVGWTRFKCKYCPYRSYQKSECRTHIQKTHNITCTTSGLEKLIICLDKNSKKEGVNNKQIKNTANNEKCVAKDQRKKQGKYYNNSVNLSDNKNSVTLKVNDSIPNKKSDIDSGEKVLIPVSIPISPVPGANVRQMSTRFSSRQLEDIDNPAKFFGTLVTRSGAYKKVNLLPNRDQSLS